MAAVHYFAGRMAGRLDDRKRAAIDGGRAERAMYGGVALLRNGVGAGTADVNRIVARSAMFGDCSAMAERERVVAAADDYLALAGDSDFIVAVAGSYRAATENGYVRLPAT